MRVFHGFDHLPQFQSPAATVGSYDGVHGGHRLLLDRIKGEAARMGGESIVLTFEPHPRITLGTQEGMRLLTSLEEKIYLLDRLGIDNLIVIPFDKAFSRIPARTFLQEYLIGKVGVRNLVVGFNHRFGSNKEGDFEQLQQWHERFGFQVTRIEEHDIDSERVSSTVIRNLILGGEMEKAARMLTHPYLVIGRMGSDGNLTVDEPYKLLPPEGRYAVTLNGRPQTLQISARGELHPEGVVPAVGEKALLTF